MINKSKKEKEFVSKCENLSYDGKGCVKFNNHVGFIANVLPGEEGSFVMTYYNSNQFYGYVKELTKTSKDRVKNHGFKIDYEINNGKFYITFKTITPGYESNLRHDSIKYEVDKDTYYNFKNSYSTEESENEIELVKNLTEKFDPVSVINPEGKIQEVK